MKWAQNFDYYSENGIKIWVTKPPQIRHLKMFPPLT